MHFLKLFAYYFYCYDWEALSICKVAVGKVKPISVVDSIWNSTGDKVSLMQIDCQVMDTKIFHILKSNIPQYNLPLSSFFLRNT